MQTDYEQGVRKTIDLTVKTENITSEVLAECMKEFLNSTAEKKGKISMTDLSLKYGDNLENIRITDDNISSFLSVAKKYDVDYALKADTTSSPTMYHVFFSANKTEDFKRAFTEYADKKQNIGYRKQRGEFTRDKMQKEADGIAEHHKKEKIRQRSKEASL